jgi:hypothetical protein
MRTWIKRVLGVYLIFLILSQLFHLMYGFYPLPYLISYIYGENLYPDGYVPSVKK